MTKANTSRKSFAEEGLEEVGSVTAEAEANVAAGTNDTGTEDELVAVGGNEPVAFYYHYKAPKKTPKNPFKIIEAGTTITGIYLRSFISGKFKNPTYLFRTEEGIVGLPGCGYLNKSNRMPSIAKGSRVKITYNGMKVIEGGEWEGSDSHTFSILAAKAKA